jgi:phosphoribosylglycinamide formyltransferase-1
LNLAVLASGAGTNLQALLDGVHDQGGIRIVAVASDRPGAPALALAEKVGVSTAVFPQSDYSSRAERDQAMATWLREHEAELVVLAGYMQLLSPEFLDRFRARVINVHPALLPAFPGLRPIEAALDYGVKVFGVTVHFVNEGVDSGPIILQRSVEIPNAQDPEAVLDQLHAIEHELLPEAVRLMASGAVRFDPANPRRVLIDDARAGGGPAVEGDR